MAILKRGLAGEPVKRLQEKLGVKADGQFGPGTEQALKDYQTKHGLAVDGVAGPDTFTQMGLYDLVLLKVGTSGDTVKKLQAALGIAADGKYGPGTEKAVREYQQKNGLVADGIAGPLTIAKMKFIKEMTVAMAEKSQMSEKDAIAAGATATADASATGKRSIWDTVKSWFN